MFPVIKRRLAGFTLVELMVTLAVFGFLLSIGVPNMTRWVIKNKAASASEFYADGFSTARRMAVSHNAETRITLTANATNAQYDWQVDICYPAPTVPCSDISGAWSTTTAPAGLDHQGAAGDLSVFRPATALPPTTMLTPSLLPSDASAIYFTPLGWVDTVVNSRLTRIQFDATPAYVADIPSSAVVVTLSGMASTCNPTVPSTDSRACPP